MRLFISSAESNSGSLFNKPSLIFAKKNDARLASPITQNSFSSEMAQSDEIPASAPPVVASKPMAAEMARQIDRPTRSRLPRCQKQFRRNQSPAALPDFQFDKNRNDRSAVDFPDIHVRG